jgi:acetylglutamate kinase
MNTTMSHTPVDNIKRQVESIKNLHSQIRKEVLHGTQPIRDAVDNHENISPIAEKNVRITFSKHLKILGLEGKNVRV